MSTTETDPGILSHTDGTWTFRCAPETPHLRIVSDGAEKPVVVTQSQQAAAMIRAESTAAIPGAEEVQRRAGSALIRAARG